MTRPEDLLSDALHDRVDRRDLPSTSMGEVVSGARRIQRRRRLRTGVVTAAVIAVLASPFVVGATRGTDDTTGPTDPPSTDTSLHTRLADVALGRPPAVAWLDGSDYVADDGTRTTLPFAHVTRVAPYRGTLIVTLYGDDHVIWLDSDLKEGWRWCGQGSFAVSQDGRSTAFAVSNSTPGCDGDVTLHLGPADPQTGGEQTRPVPPVPADLVGILGDTVVSSPYNDGTPTLLGLDGTSTSIVQLSRASAVNERLGLVSGQLAGGTVEELTGAIVDPTTGTVRWSKEGWRLDDFSPDGSMVAGVQIDAADSKSWGIFDAQTGEQLHEFAMPAGFSFTMVAWEDDEHLLMTTTQGRTQAIVRTTLDGAIQLAAAALPYTGDTQDLHYVLAPNQFP